MKKASPTPSSNVESNSSECAICCYLLPFRPSESLYKSCCGQLICMGCILGQRRVLVIGENVAYPITGSKEEEREFMEIGRSELRSVCPFCNAKNISADDNKESLKRLWERIDEYNDPTAMRVLGGLYRDGKDGVSKNHTKAKELLRSSYDLGDSLAAYHLAHMYSGSVPNPEQAREIKYLEEGARRGSVPCLISMGTRARETNNHAEAIRQFTTAARSGDDASLQNLMAYIQTPGVICTGMGMTVFKGDLATTLREHKAANDERTSVPRDYSKRYKDWISRMNDT